MPSVMRPISTLNPRIASGIKGVFCDIDDTLTQDGRLVPEAFTALAQLQAAGLHVVPVTGRPAGWVDHIARAWPVDGVVGENGGLWFYREHGRMLRGYAQDAATRHQNRKRLDGLADTILATVPGTALASDQPYRELDLAIDFCEDVAALPDTHIDQIVDGFVRAGARCKVSSIHVNGWFGDFDKHSGVTRFAKERWALTPHDLVDNWIYVGDSPNDEPMFQAFPLSVGVANVHRFAHRMTHLPHWVTTATGGHGFAEFAHHLLRQRG